MYQLVEIHWDLDEGRMKLFSIFAGTREECWSEYDRLFDDKDPNRYLVKKPSMSNCARGYPTFWDER